MDSNQEPAVSVEFLKKHVEIWWRYHDKRRKFYKNIHTMFLCLNLLMPIIMLGIYESPGLVLVSIMSLILINAVNVSTKAWKLQQKHDDAYERLIRISDFPANFQPDDKLGVRQKVFNINKSFTSVHQKTLDQATGDFNQANPEHC